MNDDSRLPDWLERFEAELEAKGRAFARDRRRRWRRWAGGTAAVALIAAPTVAYATGAWDSTPPRPGPGAGLVAEFDEPLAPGTPATVPNPSVGSTDPNVCAARPRPTLPVAGGAPTELIDLLQALRRPGPRVDVRRDDSGFRLLYVDGVRQVRAPDGTAITLIPGRGGREFSVAPEDAARCSYLLRTDRDTLALNFIGPDGGSTTTATRLQAKKVAFAILDHDPDQRPGTAIITGIAVDGVKRVRLRFHPATGRSPITLPVANNTFHARFNGSTDVPPRVEPIFNTR